MQIHSGFSYPEILATNQLHRQNLHPKLLFFSSPALSEGCKKTGPAGHPRGPGHDQGTQPGSTQGQRLSCCSQADQEGDDDPFQLLGSWPSAGRDFVSI